MNTDLNAATEHPHFRLGWQTPTAFAQTIGPQRGLTLRDLQSSPPDPVIQIGEIQTRCLAQV